MARFEADFTMKRNDTSPGIEYEIAGYPVAGIFTSATVRFLMWSIETGTLVVDEAGSVEDNDGKLRYAWQAADTATEGRYHAEFEVTYADLTVESFPPGDEQAHQYIRILIAEDLG